MKTTITLFMLLLISSQVFAQSRAERLGRQEFEMFSYHTAIEYLERVRNKTDDVHRMLGKSHLFLGNLEEAVNYFDELVRTGEPKAEDHWDYAQALMQMERYAAAQTQLQRFRTLAPNDSRAIRYAEAGDFVAEIQAMESNITVRHLRINGEHQDFGPIYYQGKLVFASSREDGAPQRGLWAGNRLPFLRPFIADKAANGELSNPRLFLPELMKGDFHVGPISMNRAEDIMAVTVNYEKDRRSGETVNLMLLVSYFIDGQWTDLEPVPFNDPDYSVGHATFTPDGKTMYFASDMPGGKGGTDIYKVSVPRDNGQWGTPQNVAAINTEGDEMFPFYHERDLLFFASDGHVGLGGLDVFYAEVDNGQYRDITNMGYPINSSRDDFGIIIDKDFLSGYFSSRRASGFGNDDLYHFMLAEPLQPIEEPVVEVVTPQPQPQPEPQPVYEPGVKIEINPIFFDFDKSNIRPDAARELDKIVEIMNEHPTMTVELGSHTDCRGTDRYNELLSLARMESSMHYIKERITNPDRLTGFYYGKTQLVNRCDCSEQPPCTEAEHQENRRTEFVIVSM